MNCKSFTFSMSASVQILENLVASSDMLKKVRRYIVGEIAPGCAVSRYYCAVLDTGV